MNRMRQLLHEGISGTGDGWKPSVSGDNGGANVGDSVFAALIGGEPFEAEDEEQRVSQSPLTAALLDERISHCIDQAILGYHQHHLSNGLANYTATGNSSPDFREMPAAGTDFDLACIPLMIQDGGDYAGEPLIPALKQEEMTENTFHGNFEETKSMDALTEVLRDVTNYGKFHQITFDTDYPEITRKPSHPNNTRKLAIRPIRSSPITTHGRGRKPHFLKKQESVQQSPVSPVPLSNISPQLPESAEQPHPQRLTDNEGPPPMQVRQKRFDGDLYTPRWIRGSGNTREGLCEQCKPAVWLRTKQSSYWYHLNFYHGISAATGRPYDAPLSRRLSKDPQNWSIITEEGLCGHCRRWVVINSRCSDDHNSDQIANMASWYRHAQKCHRSSRQ